MTVDTACEAELCPNLGAHLIPGPRGRLWWICTACRDQAAYRGDDGAPAVDALVGLLAWLGYVTGFGLFAVGLVLIATQVELVAGLTWLRWMLVIAGCAVTAWSWGVLRTRQERTLP